MRGWPIACAIVALALGGCAGEPATITKYDTRRMPPDIVIGRVLDQVAQLLASGLDEAVPIPPEEMSGTDKRRAEADIAAVVASRLGTDLAAPPPRQPLRALLDQLASLVTIWPDPYISPHPRTPLREIEFETRPHATATPNLCAMEFVAIHFTVTGPDRGPATRARASDVDINRYYYFAVPPNAPVLPRTGAAAWVTTDALCAKRDWEKDNFFRAAGEAGATKAAWLARNVIAQAAAGDARFGFVCDEERRNGSTDCARALRDEQPQFLRIGNCPDGAAPCSFSFRVSKKIDLSVTMDTATPAQNVHISEDNDMVIAEPLAD